MHLCIYSKHRFPARFPSVENDYVSIYRRVICRDGRKKEKLEGIGHAYVIVTRIWCEQLGEWILWHCRGKETRHMAKRKLGGTTGCTSNGSGWGLCKWIYGMQGTAQRIQHKLRGEIDHWAHISSVKNNPLFLWKDENGLEKESMLQCLRWIVQIFFSHAASRQRVAHICFLCVAPRQ